MEHHLDTLYENERGLILCGIPRFSTKSLWQLDPPAWLDGTFTPSPVSRQNAQAPDPSWHWSWPTWYVDMSRDVDEEGWEYSFWFVKKFPTAWHGTRPWFHSFVRRRRWIRRRERRKDGDVKVPEMEAHAMNADYFTIHSGRVRGSSQDSSAPERQRDSRYDGAPKIRPASTWDENKDRRDNDNTQPEEEADLDSIPALRKALRTAAIDRERMALVRRFLNEAGDELHYLGDEIPHIMSLFVFQTSRRQLLAILMDKYEELDELKWKSSDERGKTDEDANRRVEDLKNAMRVADSQCKKLEYWSDVKDAVGEGDTLTGVAEDRGWSPELDESGPNPDAVTEGEDARNDIAKGSKKGKGKKTEDDTSKT